MVCDVEEDGAIALFGAAANQFQCLSVALEQRRQLHGRSGHFYGRLGTLVERAVDDVGPVDQLRNRSGIEAIVGCANVGQKAGARGVLGIKELARTADRILLAVKKMLLICWRKERGLMVIEPPCDLRRG